ncbi:MFS transporter [Patescibacteria group bacterium]|nr:MFS transporter [Patescibacteria group bacterium]MBU4453003.1 MFS transporter [Patescibacteria group bacterium]MCG2687202.1 MFS transporter [Candidatus Parcubacteria bacterium]
MPKRSMPVREYFLLNINTVVRMLIISDILIVGASGLMSPIFAIYIENFIVGGGVAVAGIAASIYLITKSIFQIPIASILDRIRGEKDDFWILFLGSLFGALIPLAYIFISTPIELYFVQFCVGLTGAALFPAYMAIFTRHIDRHREGTEWGLYFTLVDMSSAVMASIGGILAATVGFEWLIILLSCVGVIGSLLLLNIRPYIKTHN